MDNFLQAPSNKLLCQVNAQCFFFGKTTEILGKINFVGKRISVDFFLPRKNYSHFLNVNTLKNSSRFLLLRKHLLSFFKKSLNEKNYREKLNSFTKKKMTEKSHRVFFTEKITEIFTEKNWMDVPRKSDREETPRFLLRKTTGIFDRER